MIRYGPARRRLSAAHQAIALRQRCPGFTARASRRHLLARGIVQPTPACNVYRVRIEFEEDHFPRVFVESPSIISNARGMRPPHLYREAGDPLCLFYPLNREWDWSMEIARTIVPWTVEWLLYFEIWEATGEWSGGGAEHAPPATQES